MKLHDLYNKDFYAWTEQMTQALKKGALDEVDIEHLAEEVESMGASEFRELRNRLIVLLAHLLKWQYQPDGRSTGWRGTISEQRRRLALLFLDSPSLKNKAYQVLQDDFIISKALRIVSDYTGLTTDQLPRQCPYHLDQLLDDDFFPNSQ